MRKFLKPILIVIAVSIVILGFGILAYNQDSKIKIQETADNTLITGTIDSILIGKDTLMIIIEDGDLEIWINVEHDEYINLSSELIGQEITVEGNKTSTETKIFVDAVDIYGIE